MLDATQFSLVATVAYALGKYVGFGIVVVLILAFVIAKVVKKK
jgi:hypothetical protein